MTWLHCNALQSITITPNQPNKLMTILFAAHYVTGVNVGPTFQIRKNRQSTNDIGLFPPNQPAPADALPLDEVQHFIAQLLAPERN